MNKTNKEWENEFDEKFPRLGEEEVGAIYRFCRIMDLPEGDSRSIKSFISQIIIQARDEGYSKGYDDRGAQGSESLRTALEMVKTTKAETLEKVREMVVEEIKKIPTEYPDHESDDFDKGNKNMKDKILSLLSIKL